MCIQTTEESRKRKIRDRLEANAVKRKRGLEVWGETRVTESNAIRFLSKYICNLLPVTDGAHADLVKCSDMCERTGWGIQIKSASKRYVNGNASFYRVNKYPDLVVICVLLSERRVWLFHGRELMHLQKLSIGKRSKYNHNEVALENLDQRLTTMLEEYAQHELEHFNRQLYPTHLNEYLTHQRWVTLTKATVRQKELGALENEIVDYVEIRGNLELKIQEKIADLRGNCFRAPLRKNSGSNGVRQTLQPYEEGDCDVYRVFVNKYDNEWRHRRDKSKIEAGTTIGWFEFPEGILIERGYISTNKIIGKQDLRCYLPEDVCLNVDFPFPAGRPTSLWTRDYFHRM